jgi:hypothetical protein
VAAVGLFGLCATAAAASSWGRPFRLAPPQASDILPARIAFSPAGDAAVAFRVQQEDDPGISEALVTVRSAGGRPGGVRRVPGAQQVLDLGFAGPGLELLTSTASGGRACCDSAGAVTYARSAFSGGRQLLSKLTGPTIGSLTVLAGGGKLAALATDRGAWVGLAGANGRFGPLRRVNAAGQMPWTVASTALPSGQTTVAWTATTGQFGTPGPNRILVASGSAHRAPGGARVAISVGSGHQIDELALTPGGSRVTAAWVETWFDRGGIYHSQPVVSDLGAGSPRTFPVAGQPASGLALAGDGRGDQVLVWKTCSPSTTCSVQAALRDPGARFGAPIRLGTIDSYEDPVAAISPGGAALVGWISGGRVLAAASPGSGRRLAPAHLVSAAGDAANLALAFGPRGRALAAWAQGTSAPELVGAEYR